MRKVTLEPLELEDLVRDRGGVLTVTFQDIMEG
jgi:hypothetical protein